MSINYKSNIRDMFLNGGYRIKQNFYDVNNNNINNTFFNDNDNNNSYGGSKEIIMNRFVDLVVPFGLVFSKEDTKENINQNSNNEVIRNDKFDSLFNNMVHKKISNNRVTRKNRKT